MFGEMQSFRYGSSSLRPTPRAASGKDLVSQLDLYAPQVMRYVAPGLYPAIRGSTPRGRTSDVGYDIYAE